MRPFAAKIACAAVLVFACASPGMAEDTPADPPECGSQPKPAVQTYKTAIFKADPHLVRAYGLVTMDPVHGKAEHASCHVVYQFWVAAEGKSFSSVLQVEAEVEQGRSAGIEVLGPSPNGMYLAADLWEGAGDWMGHHPAIYDLTTHKAASRPLGDLLEKQAPGCGQSSTFIGATDTGEAVFDLPKSDQSDSPNCGDKGRWSFDLSTGAVRQVAKKSGTKHRAGA